MRRLQSILAALAFALAALAALPAAAQEVADIAAQPDRAQLEAWKAAGITTVINMRTEAEMAELDYDEAAAVEALGMTYVAVPLDSANATPDVTAALGAALDGADGKVALHCRSGSRAANALAALAIERGEADPATVESPDPDLTLIGGLMRRLSPRYAEGCATC